MFGPRSRLTPGLLCLALAVAGCAADTPIRPRAGSPTQAVERGAVMAIGDSVMQGARDYGELAALLTADGWTPEIVADKGRSVLWATEQIELRTEVPRSVVAILGLNPSPTLGNFPAEVDAFVAALTSRGARRILWVPPHHVDPARYAERADALRAIEGDAVDVLDWPVLIDANPHWYQSDGLHLTADGYAALALFIRDSLATA